MPESGPSAAGVLSLLYRTVAVPFVLCTAVWIRLCRAAFFALLSPGRIPIAWLQRCLRLSLKPATPSSSSATPSSHLTLPPSPPIVEIVPQGSPALASISSQDSSSSDSSPSPSLVVSSASPPSSPSSSATLAPPTAATMPYTPPHKINTSGTNGSLSAAALRIAHSRSASDIGLSTMPGAAAAIASILSPSGIDDSPGSPESFESVDSDHRIAGKMVRKKSGELVKPALRDSSRPRRPVSVPGTPLQAKAVHFRDNIAQVRHFLWQDRPMAVSAGSSPVLAYESDTEFPFPNLAAAANAAAASRKVWEIRNVNWPDENAMKSRSSAPVQLERLFLSADGSSLVGSVAVANISFHKSVVCRFTLDHWVTVSEVSAEYSDDAASSTGDSFPPPPPGFDRFVFNIRLDTLSRPDTRPLFACIRYNVAGQEHWDNNNGANYHVEFQKLTSPSKVVSKPPAPLSGIPRSRRSANLRKPSPGSVPTPLSQNSTETDDDDECPYPFRSRRRREVTTSTDSDSDCPPLRLKPRNRTSNISDPLSGRYDFSLSVHTPTGKPSVPEPQFALTTISDGAKKADVGSDEYQNLLAKFCFFAPTVKSKVTPPVISTVVSPGSGSPQPLSTNVPQVLLPPVQLVGESIVEVEKSAVPELILDTRGSDSSEERSSSANSSPECSGSSTPPSPEFTPLTSSLGLDFPSPASWPPSASSTPGPTSHIPLDISSFATFRSRSASPAFAGRHQHRTTHSHLRPFSMPSFPEHRHHQAPCIRG